MFQAPNILIVDDSATTRAMVRRIIRMTGIQTGSIYEAPDGAVALGILRTQAETQPVDLMLTDLNMPDMEGAELTRLVRADPRIAATRVIVISAQPDEESSGPDLRSKVQGWLCKPFTPEAVRDMIKQVLVGTGVQA